MRRLRLGSMLTAVTGLALASQLLLAAPQGGHPAGPHHPPHDGKWIRGHWTPYEPPDPDLFPEESRVHIIVPGDTLWDLSGQYLGDPWLWPQLWDQNRYILDSHWIYPGDPLLIPPPPTVVAGPGGTEDQVPPPTTVRPILEDQPPEEVEPGPPALVGPELRPVASETDLYCSSYVDEPTMAEPELYVAQREEEAKNLLSDWDVVYLSQGLAAGVMPGNEYLVYRPGELVEHPATGEILGQEVRQVGRLKVLASQELSATAYVSASCDAIHLGDRLVPFEEVPVPLTVYPGWERYGVDLSDVPKGFIVYGGDYDALGMGQLVDLDMGTAQGIEAGDYLLIYRDYRDPVAFNSTVTYIDPAVDTEASDQFPPNILGQVVVIRAKEHTSTAKIVRSAREVMVGDKVAKK